MGVLKLLVSLFMVFVAYKVAENVMHEPTLPTLDPDPWWGPGEPKPQDESLKPFKINIPKKEVQDLNDRLALPLRLTSPLEDSNFSYGLNQNTLEKIISYWRSEYSWKKREAKLNKYPHFKTQIEGLNIHFMKASAQVDKNSNVKVVPLLLVHGWPGSIVEFYGILPLLTTPREGSNVVFEVICPSIPGYGFSEASSKIGLGHLQTGQIFLKLMKRLGYEQFYLQGGDWGAMIVSDMATMYPENILGVHMNMIASNTLGGNIKMILGAILPTGLIVSEEDQDKLYPLLDRFSMLARESGYLHIQATKPDTVGAAVNQSPVSLAAYLLEKFSTWTNKGYVDLPDGGLLQPDFPIALDSILDNICVYWFTGSITSSMRYYAENISKRYSELNVENIPCHVPTGLAAFPQELLNQPKNYAAHKFHNIITYTNKPAGGHFAALERPEILAEDVFAFVNAVEKLE